MSDPGTSNAEILALVMSGLAIVLSIIALYRTERREGRREEREIEVHTASRRGQPILDPSGTHGGPTAGSVVHQYVAKNGGEAQITGLWLWIEDDGGNVVSGVSGGDAIVIAPGQTGAVLGVEVRQPLPATQMLMVRWLDAAGDHTEATGIRPKRHA